MTFRKTLRTHEEGAESTRVNRKERAALDRSEGGSLNLVNLRELGQNPGGSQRTLKAYGAQETILC
jgi:hypothetical protein